MLYKLLTALLYLTVIADVLPATAQPAIEQISVSGRTTSLAVNPLSNKIYVASISSSEESSAILSLLDGRTKTVIQSLTLGFDTPGRVIVNPVSSKVYMQACNFLFVPNPVCDLLIFDNALNRLADLPDTGPAVAVNPRTDQIYILNESGFAILNGHTNQSSASSPCLALAESPSIRSGSAICRCQ